MIAQTSIEAVKTLEGSRGSWALKSPPTQALWAGGTLQLGLFDNRNLFELTDPTYPEERLVGCRARAPETARV